MTIDCWIFDLRMPIADFKSLVRDALGGKPKTCPPAGEIDNHKCFVNCQY
jgi:hypothetical protein